MLFIFRSSAIRGIQDTLVRQNLRPSLPPPHLNLLALCQCLNSGNSLLQKLLPERRLGDLCVNGGLNGLNERGLFGFSLLLFVSDPAVEDGLEFGLDGVFLGELEVGVLKGGGFLRVVNDTGGRDG
jgi:hypothetical protein